jgi:hypothetical protein
MSAPAIVEQGARALKVMDLSTTALATELTFEIRDDDAQAACLNGSLDHQALQKADVRLRDERGAEYPPSQNGSQSIGIGQHEFGFFSRTMAFERLPADARRVVLAVRGFGEWDVPVDLAPIAGTGAVVVQDVAAEASARDITLRLVRTAFGPNETFLEVEAIPAKTGIVLRGIGDIQRTGDERFVLVDASDMHFVEELSRETVRRGEVHPSRAHAKFPALPPQARDLTLIVPSVTVEDPEPALELALPLDERREMRFGRYPILIGPSGFADLPNVPGKPPRYGLCFAMGPANPDGDEQATRPLAVGVESPAKRWNWGSGWHPEAGLRNVSVDVERGAQPRSVQLEGAEVKIRGPWEIRFRRTA